MPKTLPTLPGIDLAGWMHPSDAVDGDYLDFLSTEESAGRGLGVAVGDISGHGPASALLMTAARAILRMRAAQPGSLSEVVADLNRRRGLLRRDSAKRRRDPGGRETHIKHVALISEKHSARLLC